MSSFSLHYKLLRICDGDEFPGSNVFPSPVILKKDGFLACLQVLFSGKVKNVHNIFRKTHYKLGRLFTEILVFFFLLTSLPFLSRWALGHYDLRGVCLYNGCRLYQCKRKKWSGTEMKVTKFCKQGDLDRKYVPRGTEIAAEYTSVGTLEFLLKFIIQLKHSFQ